MDLDAFHREFVAFKRRVQPMLDEYEAHVARGGGARPEMDPDLAAEIYKPLEPAKVDSEPKTATGPTLAQWLGAGKKASEYPPAGYESNSPQSEIDDAIAAEKAGT